MENRSQFQSGDKGKLWLIVPAAALVYLLKSYYCTADNNDLDWILALTARLVGVMSGMQFFRDRQLGWSNDDHSIIIAPACSGMNFLCLLSAMVLLQIIFSYLSWRKTAALFPLVFALCLPATLLVNAVRICISIHQLEAAGHLSWLSFGDIHRITGTVVYYLCLVILFMGVSGLLQRVSAAPKGAWRKLPALALPLFCYLGFVIGIPALRQLDQGISPGLVHHSLTVITISFTITAFLWVLISAPGLHKILFFFARIFHEVFYLRCKAQDGKR